LYPLPGSPLNGVYRCKKRAGSRPGRTIQTLNAIGRQTLPKRSHLGPRKAPRLSFTPSPTVPEDRGSKEGWTGERGTVLAIAPWQRSRACPAQAPRAGSSSTRASTRSEVTRRARTREWAVKYGIKGRSRVRMPFTAPWFFEMNELAACGNVGAN
jgi:hypothetical protein